MHNWIDDPLEINAQRATNVLRNLTMTQIDHGCDCPSCQTGNPCAESDRLQNTVRKKWTRRKRLAELFEIPGEE